jgi:hypothetical protein
VIALGVWLVVQSSGSSAVTQTRSVAPFSGVQLAGSNLVTIRVGTEQSVAVHARKDMLDRVTTQVVGGTLVIADAAGNGSTKGPMTVSVTVPALDSLSIPASGSGIVTATGIDTAAFTVTLSGSGVIRASGTTTRLDVTVGGSGDAELQPLGARDVRALVSGSGAVAVTANRSLNASVTGDGVIRYAGNPTQLSTSVTGTGVIIPG